MFLPSNRYFLLCLPYSDVYPQTPDWEGRVLVMAGVWGVIELSWQLTSLLREGFSCLLGTCSAKIKCKLDNYFFFLPYS